MLKPRIDSKTYVVGGYRLEIPDNYCLVALTHCGGRPTIDVLTIPGQEKHHLPANVFIIRRAKIRRFRSSVEMYRRLIEKPEHWQELLGWARALKRTGEYGEIRELWQGAKAK